MEAELQKEEQQLADFQSLFAKDDVLEKLLADDFESLSFSKELLDSFISRIVVGENNSLALSFTFEDQVMKKAELMEVIL